MKLESLKDRPATKEDIGKTVYKPLYYDENAQLLMFQEYEITGIDIGAYMVHFGRRTEKGLVTDGSYSLGTTNLFWQKPILISEEEYIKLSELTDSKEVK